MAVPKPGASYVLTETLGADDSPARVPAGTKVTVREVVDAATPGAGDDSEDCVVVEFDVAYLGQDDAGEPVVSHIPRSFSVPVSKFADQFTKES